jgi:DivIVA domain-containing protein
VLTVLSILGVLAVLFVAAAVATREGPVLLDAPVDAADVQLPDGPLQPEDLRAVRFALAVRGYRMDEVDGVIERAASELAERDERIAALATAPADISTPARSAVDSPVASVVLKPASAAVPAGPDHPDGPSEPDTDTDTAEAEPVVAEEADREPVASLLNEPDPEDDDAAVTAVPEEKTEPAPDVPPDGAPVDEAPVDEAPVDAAPADKDATAVLPPSPPPVEVAVVRTEVAPVPTAVRLPVADEDESPAT